MHCWGHYKVCDNPLGEQFSKSHQEGGKKMSFSPEILLLGIHSKEITIYNKDEVVSQSIIYNSTNYRGNILNVQ